MKRKLNVFLCLIMVIAMVAACVSGCSGTADQPSGGECEHTFSDKWSSDADNHWHAATCEHGEIKDSQSAHMDADEDGKCDVCAYEIGHTHTFASEWSSNETHHWKAATCSHTTEQSELDLHSDVDFDGECDVCAGHSHVVDASGMCTVCGEQVLEIDSEDISSVIQAIVARYNSVCSGKIEYSYKGISAGEDGTADISKVIEYVFGTDSTYIKTTSKSTTNVPEQGITTTSDMLEGWYQLISADNVFGVICENGKGDFTMDGSASPDKLHGYYYSVSTLADGYGAENVLAVLYDLSQAEIYATEYVENFDSETNTYQFSFNYLSVNSDVAEGEDDNVNYYEVEVSFTYSEDHVLTALSIVCDCYSNSLANQKDHDFTWDQNTGTITMLDTAIADTYTFNVTQVAGERTYVNEHPRSEFIPDSFDFYSDKELTNKVSGNYDAFVDVIAKLYLGNFKPSNTSLSFVAEDVKVSVDASEDKFVCSIDPISCTVIMYAKAEGTYTVTVSYANISKSVKVKVTVAPTEEIEVPDNGIKVTVTDNNAWNDLVTFTAPESGVYSFVIPELYGAWDKEDYDTNMFSTPLVDPYDFDEEDSTFDVSLAAGESYSFYFLAPTKGDHVIIYNFTAGDVGGDGGSEGDGGEEGGDTVPDDIGGLYTHTSPYVGTLEVLIDSAASTVTFTVDGRQTTFAYTLSDGDVVLYNDNGEAWNSMFYDIILTDGVPTTAVYNGNSYLLEASDGEDDGEGDGETGDDTEPAGDTLTIGSNTISVTDEDIANGGKDYTLVVTEEGTYSFTSSYLMANIYDADGNMISRNEAYLTAGTYQISVSTSFVFEADDYNLTLTYTAPEASGEGDGSEGDPYQIELPTQITFNSDTINKIYYVFTASESGVLKITYPTADSWVDVFKWVDGEADGSDSHSEYLTQVVEFAVEAGSSYRIGLGTWAVSGEVTIDLAIDASAAPGGGEGEDGGEDGDEGGEDTPAVSDTLTAGTNNIMISDDEFGADVAYRTLTVDTTGEYKFVSGSLFVAAVTDAEGNTIVKNDDYEYALEAGETYTVKFSMLSMFGAQPNVVIGLSVDLQIDEPDPLVVGGNSVSFTQDEISADSADRYLIVGADGNYSFNSGSLYIASVKDSAGNPLTRNEDYTYTLTSGTSYTVNFGLLSMFGVQADTPYELNVVLSDSGEGDNEGDSTDSVKDSLYGTYVMDGYSLFFYNSEGVYYMNAYAGNMTWDIYFTYELLENGDGSYTVVPAYASRPGVEVGTDVLGIENATIIAAPNSEGGWDITVTGITSVPDEGGDEDETPEITGDTYIGTDSWGNAPLTLVVGETSVSFIYEHPMMGSSSVTYTYAVVDGAMVLYNDDGTELNPLAGSVTLTDGVPTAASYNGTNYTLAAEGGEGDDGEDGDDTAVELDSITVTTTDTYGYFDLYSYTAAEAGTYTFTVPAGLGLYSKASYDAWGAAEVDFFNSPEGGTVTVELAAGETYEFFVGSMSKGDWTIGVSFAASEVSGEGDGSEDDGEDTAAALVAGANSVIFTQAEVTADSADRVLTVSADGNYSFNAGSLYIGSVKDSAGNQLTRNEDYTYTLAAGESYTVTFKLLTMFGVQADMQYELNIVLTESQDQQQADGSDSNPFELQENNTCAFPGGYSYIFYTYIAENAGSLTINVDGDDFYWGYGSGPYALSIENAGYTSATHTIAVAAGETLWIGMSTNSMNAGEITFTAVFTADEGGEDEATESESYIGTDAWGNAPLTLVVSDATVTFIYEHPMMGTTSATYTYEIVDGAMVLYNEDGTELNPLAGSVTLTDGVPTAASYNGTNYTLAAEGGESEGDEEDGSENEGSEGTPVELDPISVTTTDTYGYFDLYTCTAAEAGTYTFTVPAGLGLYSVASYDAWGPAEVDFYSTPEGGTVTVELAAGENYEFYVGAMIKGDWVISVSAILSESAAVEPEPISVTTTDTYGYFDLYSFTAAEAGTYTFGVPAGLGLYSVASYDAWGPAEVDFYSSPEGGTVTVELAAGETYEFYVGSMTKGDWTISVDYEA